MFIYLSVYPSLYRSEKWIGQSFPPFISSSQYLLRGRKKARERERKWLDIVLHTSRIPLLKSVAKDVSLSVCLSRYLCLCFAFHTYSSTCPTCIFLSAHLFTFCFFVCFLCLTLFLHSFVCPDFCVAIRKFCLLSFLSLSVIVIEGDEKWREGWVLSH